MIRRTPTSVQLRLNGYTYYKKDTTNGKNYWRCILFRSGSCGATAITRETTNGVQVLKEGVHGHPGEDFSSDAEADDPSEGSQPSRSESDNTEQSDDEQSDDMSEEEQSEREGKQWEPWEEDTDIEDEDEEGFQEEDQYDQDELDEDMEDVESDEDSGDTFTMLMEKLKQHKHALRNLSTDSATLREAVLKEADKALICFLCEISWNMLNGYFDLRKHEKNILRLYKDEYRGLASENLTWVHKKDALVASAHEHLIPLLLNVLLPHL